MARQTAAGVKETFRYDGADAPGARERGKGRGKSYDLVENGDVISTVQVFAEGEGTPSHMHPDQDGYWFVLAGHAQFKDGDGNVFADLHKNQGTYIPHDNRYSFTSMDEKEPLELLRVSRIVPKDED